MRVAIVHDYLNQYGGAERTLEVMCELFPDAPIYTLFYDEVGTKGRFRNRVVHTSFLDRVPFVGKRIGAIDHLLFWLLPIAVERFDLSGYDMVLSSSATYAKGVRVPAGVPHVCYCYTPTRYLWEDVRNYVSGFLANPLVRFVGEFFFGPVRAWDFRAAQRPHKIAAISNHIARRIKEVYKRDADAVIFPPVDISKYRNVDTSRPRQYFLMAGRLLPYKKFDLGIEVANALGLPLKIIGEGRDRTRLEAIAGPTVEFLGWVDDAKLTELYAGARAIIFPQVEDFGLVAAEAIAVGTPVIAYRGGGAIDIVEENKGGIFFDAQTVESLSEAVKKFSSTRFDPTAVAHTAQKFDKAVFKQELARMVGTAVKEV